MSIPAQTAPRISYVVPVHNEEAVLGRSVRLIVARLAEAAPRSEVILVENGSSDSSQLLVHRLSAECSTPHVTVRAATSPKGYGAAAREGLRIASGDLVVLTAADLPFAFTDLDEALSLDPRPPLIIGSKHHPLSTVQVKWTRRLLSYGFRRLRTLVLGIRTGDTQGSMLVDGNLARSLRSELRCRDYLFLTELVACAATNGVLPVEVPVIYEHARDDSKVHPIADSVHMLAGLYGLHRRFGNLRRIWVDPVSRRRDAADGTRMPVG
jgi:glycosyltransferase involved in cell wall biosynthesis